VNEAAVPPTRAAAALLRLEQDDVEPRLAVPQCKRRPEARVAAADDRDVCLRVTLERRRGLAAEASGERFLEPPDVA
jgi:hypothetical protein